MFKNLQHDVKCHIIALNLKSLSIEQIEFNADKTEFIWLGTRQQLLKVTHQSLVVNDVSVAPVNRVRDLGVIIDVELTMMAHVNQVISARFYQL